MATDRLVLMSESTDKLQQMNLQKVSLKMNMKIFAGVNWNRLAADRDEWRRLGEAFILQWTQ